ncbi:MAG: hypothetical protein PHC95_06135 [Parabacteroides sp.]|nr:hypothetical protein [Parabacteroides sp.]
MTLIANPIYDAVFKFMMEDEKVAKLLLSALLKKEIVELQMRQHEYTSVQQTRISLFRMDFSAKIRDNDGTEHLVLIELQKTWLATETLRFRQYLGTHYLSKNNMRENGGSRYGLPIISIYILGHTLGDLKEPVVYVRRCYLDYDDQVIEQKDPFIESLTHDSIIVQIPYLQGRTRNHLERLLNVFDQDYRTPQDEHLLEIDESIFSATEQIIITRLLRAGVEPDVRRSMEVEDEILSEIEKRDTDIMQKEQELEQKRREIEQNKQVIEQKTQEIEQSKQVIEQSKQEIEQSKQVIEQKNKMLQEMVRMLTQAGIPIEEIAQKLSLSSLEVKKLI